MKYMMKYWLTNMTNIHCIEIVKMSRPVGELNPGPSSYWKHWIFTKLPQTLYIHKNCNFSVQFEEMDRLLLRYKFKRNVRNLLLGLHFCQLWAVLSKSNLNDKAWTLVIQCRHWGEGLSEGQSEEWAVRNTPNTNSRVCIFVLEWSILKRIWWFHQHDQRKQTPKYTQDDNSVIFL